LWDSAGKITDDGYTVEIRLPLQTIRFSGGDQVRMGIVFFRKISRTGVSYSWPEMLPNSWVFDNPGHLIFDNLKQPRLIELLPSITYGISQTRKAAGAWSPANNKADVGLSAKYGITSNITLDATINPDFSQVESDAFQVEVNQRFPIFYSEKRPFFMEAWASSISREAATCGRRCIHAASSIRRGAVTDGHRRQNDFRLAQCLG
jgi:hypothetical protein